MILADKIISLRKVAGGACRAVQPLRSGRKGTLIIWAVAGVLYGAVAAAVNAFEHSK